MEDYQNLLFAKDGEIYDFDGKKAIVIGGAYSIDKYYRLRNGLPWFESEFPTEDMKDYDSWYAGHYHVECQEGRVRIMFNDYEEL